METGDVVFVRGHSFISRIIEYFDKGKFSHVAIFVSDNAIIEVEHNTKSRIVPFEYKDYEIINLELTNKQKEIIQELSFKLLGHKYDYRQMIGYLVRFFNKNYKIHNSPKKYICSELVEIILQEVGYIPKDKKLRELSPNELYNYLTGK